MEVSIPRRSLTASSVLLLGISCLLWLAIHSPCASSLTFDLNFSEPKPFCGAVINCSGKASVDLGILELTGNGGVGRATYGQPVPLWHAARPSAAATDKLLASFATSFTFRITPDPKQRNTGDGIAFFLAPYPTASLIPPNSGGGNLGLLPTADTSWTGDGHFVAVEFDTWWNGPAVDINDNHVAIDVNSIVSVASNSTSSPTRNLTSNLDMTATINYGNGSKLLAVDLQINGSSYHVETVLDLSSILPEEVAVGFSAATGSSSEMHRVLTWSFTSTLHSSDDTTIVSRRLSVATVLLSVAVPLLFLSLCVVAGGCLLLRRRRWRRRSTPDDDEAAAVGDDSADYEEHYGGAELERGVAAGGPRRYTYRELAAATCNFAEDRKLGRGGFGSVYRGQLLITVGDHDHDNQDSPPAHVDVAIKVLSSESSAQGRKEFEAEVRIISRLKHRNLVRLLGWCDSRSGLMLVYELVAQGSLDRHLYGRGSRFLPWPQRYQIILGLGSALRYLHEEWEQCIVHGDIKPSNIMLDESHCAKLGDFGLARLVDHGAGWQTTKAVLGTAGYIDPEFVNTRRPSTQSDVYSFGVLLLEIVSNRPPVLLLQQQQQQQQQEEEEAAAGQQQLSLLKWVWGLYGRNATLDAADERLRGDDDDNDERHKQCVERVLVVGLWCAHPDPCERPSIGQAMHVLQSEDNTRLPALRPQMYKTMMSDLATVPAGQSYGSLSIDDAHSGVRSSSPATGNSNLSSSDSSAMALLANSRDFA